MSDSVDIKVSPDLVRSIIETKVQTAIVEALDSETGIVERVITAAMGLKVNNEGKVDNYGDRNKRTMLEWMCHQVVNKAAEAAVAKWVAERHDVLEAEFLKHLHTKKASSAMVRACVDGLAAATASKWRFSVNIGAD